MAINRNDTTKNESKILKPPRKKKIQDALIKANRTASLDSGYHSLGRLDEETYKESHGNETIERSEGQLPKLSDNNISQSIPNLVTTIYPLDQDLGQPRDNLNVSDGTPPPLPGRHWRRSSLSTLEEQKASA